MSRTKRITDSIRAQVLELREKGYTLKAIAIELDISLSSVKRFKAEGSKNKIKGSSSEVQNLNIEVQDEMQISNFQIKGSSLEKNLSLAKNTEQVNSSVKQLIDDKNFERLKNIVLKYYDTLRAKITDEEIQSIAEKIILNIPKGLKIDIEI